MPRKTYCPMGQRHCRHAIKHASLTACRLTDNPLTVFNGCVRDIQNRHAHRVETWFRDHGWTTRHHFMRGNGYAKDGVEVILDAAGVAINNQCLLSSDEARAKLSPFMPEWVVNELAHRVDARRKHNAQSDPYNRTSQL